MVAQPMQQQVPFELMKWSKFTGTIMGRKAKATCELIEADGEPEWFCMCGKISDEFGSCVRETFKKGELEKANQWCIDQLNKHENVNE